MKTIYRYPGVKPFGSDNRHLFFGRDEDIAELFELIRLDKLVVLFAKSGYGKSSLLNAGIIPLFQGREEICYTPIKLRFGPYGKEENQALLHKTVDTLKRELPANPAAAFLDGLMPDGTLWYHCKRRQTPENPRLLLVFDQFEEFFTYPEGQQRRFKYELAEALYKVLPQRLRDLSEDCSEEEFELLAQPLEVKAVFAIRSDRLHHLDSLKDALPAVMHHRYELKALSRDQARSAIVNPAQADAPKGAEAMGRAFISPPFAYDTNALEAMLDSLSAGSKTPDSGIEPHHLQILCRFLEEKVMDGNIRYRNTNGWPLIQQKDLPDTSQLFENYYRHKLRKLQPRERKAVRLLIEEELLFQDPQTGDLRRLSVDGSALGLRFGDPAVTQALFKQLVDLYLLRREPNSTGGFNYEISHDTLMAPIAAARNGRRKGEKRIAARQELEKAKAKLQQEEAARRREEHLRQTAIGQRKLRRLNIIWSIFAGILMIIGFFFLSDAIKSQKKQRETLNDMEVLKQNWESRLLDLEQDFQFGLDRDLVSNYQPEEDAKGSEEKQQIIYLLNIAKEFQLAQNLTLAEMALDSCLRILDNPKSHLSEKVRNDYRIEYQATLNDVISTEMVKQ